MSTAPLDPTTPQGVELAERLTRTLAGIRAAIAERQRLAERAELEDTRQPAQQAA